ncbi:alpha/beta hydrolase [Nakamurella multipartita]|nr:alpha/beta fold hydrolase [Nakamurella multipartita]
MDTSLMSGWLSWLVLGLGVAGAAFLLVRRPRWWWLYVVPPVVLVSAVTGWLLGTVGGEKLFAQPLTGSDIFWIAIALAAIGLAVGQQVRSPWWRKIVAVVAAVLVLAAAGNQINKNYQEFPAVKDLFGPSGTDQSSLPPVTPQTTRPTTPSGPLTATWAPTGANIPADSKGKILPFTIPPTQSGFSARPGWVYLPPAYFADNREPLPVLILFHGQPGSPDDWITGDRVQTVMNDFAAQHNGIAPVVVIPDVLGSQLANPICADSSLGNVDTYLAKDLPAAIASQLDVDQDHRHWVVGGFSYGGTCALQMATNHPDVYPHFVNISGEKEPTLGSGDTARKTTVDAAFGGDEAKFVAINPADLMQKHSFPDSSGWFIWGQADPDTKLQQIRNDQLATTAGMNVQIWEVPETGHDWGTAASGLAHVMPWMATTMGLTG